MTPKVEEYKALVNDADALAEEGGEAPHVAKMGELYHSLTPREQAYLAVYYECLSEGCNEKLADMLASQTPPGAMTDNVFMEGHCNGNQFEKRPEFGDYLKRVAESEGQNVKGKVYLGGLARYPGDPEAWVDGRADVERVCRKRGWGVSGAVSVPVQGAGQLPGRKRKPLAQRLHEKGLPVGSD